jgi:hypothetical protein
VAEYAMKVTTLRLPETMHESIEAEAAEQEMSVAEYIRAVLRTRQEHTPEHLSEPAAGASAGEYDELRERVGELEERVDELEEQAEFNQQTGDDVGSALVNETTDIDLSGVPSSGSNPYGEHVETAGRPTPCPKDGRCGPPHFLGRRFQKRVVTSTLISCRAGLWTSACHSL